MNPTHAHHPPFILPLNDPRADLQTAGGKGQNLSRLARAGFQVPDGFLISTAAYWAYLDANQLQAAIENALKQVDAQDPDSLESASQTLRAHFRAGHMPPELQRQLAAAYTDLGLGPVAVRSSATAEDLPDLSFAGQQDTYLNVLGQPALQQAVVDCWSSLWTARAIGYRARNGLEQQQVALAVVVQCMVQSQVSGVLFTANPVSGLRSETVIDATFGLGEALVSGQVEPDHYVVDTREGVIRAKTLGAKSMTIRGREAGGVETIEADNAKQQALSDADILKLAQLGQQVAEEYDYPQDIEWATVEGQLFLLQSRPITSLFPTPPLSDPNDLNVYFSLAHVQGMLDPLTPLGVDALRMVMVGAADLLNPQQQLDPPKFLSQAGMRLWLNFTGVVRNPLGRRLLPAFFDFIEAGSAPFLQTLLDDPRLQTERGGLRWRTLHRLGRFFLPLVGRAIRYIRRPDAWRERLEHETETFIQQFEASVEQAPKGQPAVQHAVKSLRALALGFPFLLPRYIPTIAVGMGALNLIQRLSGQNTQRHGQNQRFSALVLEVSRGLPHNITTQMDLALWQVAEQIRSNPQACARFQAASAEELARDYLAGALPAAAQAATAGFLARFGMRGPAEIDLGRKRWREDPRQVMQVLQSYLALDDQGSSPEQAFRQGKQAAEAALAQLLQQAGQQRLGGLRQRLVRGAYQRYRALAGLRESPKYYMVRMMGAIRQELLAAGAQMVQSGQLVQVDDIFFLELSELDRLADREAPPLDLPALVRERRARYQREMGRQQVPRLLLSDGRAFYGGSSQPAEADEGAVLTGSPVSPGVREGRVRVVFDPHGVRLEPGEILVCPGTDPAWTPLFLAAGGLVMEVGGMMTHGSVVAREYGIPAVVGIQGATRRLQTGQWVRVDGSNGTVTLLSEPAEEEAESA